MRRSASSMSAVGPANDSRTNDAAAHGVEVDARVRSQRRCRPTASSRTTASPSVRSRDVGVDVERAVGRREPVDPDPAQSVEQQLAVGGVVLRAGASDSAIDSGVNAATAANCGSTGGQMVKLPVRQSTARCSSLRHQQPAQPPARHREVLREAVHHNGIPRCLPRAAGLRAHRDTPARGTPRR